MNEKTQQKILKKISSKAFVLSQKALIVFALLMLVALLPFAILTPEIGVTLLLIVIIVFVPFLIVNPIFLLIKIKKRKEKILNGEYRIVHEKIIEKNYTELDDLTEEEWLSEYAERAKVTLEDDTGKTRMTSARVPEFVDADIDDNFFSVYINDEDEPICIFTEKEYSE